MGITANHVRWNTAPSQRYFWDKVTPQPEIATLNKLRLLTDNTTSSTFSFLPQLHFLQYQLLDLEIESKEDTLLLFYSTYLDSLL